MRNVKSEPEKSESLDATDCRPVDRQRIQALHSARQTVHEVLEYLGCKPPHLTSLLYYPLLAVDPEFTLAHFTTEAWLGSGNSLETDGFQWFFADRRDPQLLRDFTAAAFTAEHGWRERETLVGLIVRSAIRLDDAEMLDLLVTEYQISPAKVVCALVSDIGRGAFLHGLFSPDDSGPSLMRSFISRCVSDPVHGADWKEEVLDTIRNEFRWTYSRCKPDLTEPLEKFCAKLELFETARVELGSTEIFPDAVRRAWTLQAAILACVNWRESLPPVLEAFMRGQCTEPFAQHLLRENRLPSFADLVSGQAAVSRADFGGLESFWKNSGHVAPELLFHFTIRLLERTLSDAIPASRNTRASVEVHEITRSDFSWEMVALPLFGSIITGIPKLLKGVGADLGNALQDTSDSDRLKQVFVQSFQHHCSSIPCKEVRAALRQKAPEFAEDLLHPPANPLSACGRLENGFNRSQLFETVMDKARIRLQMSEAGCPSRFHGPGADLEALSEWIFYQDFRTEIFRWMKKEYSEVFNYFEREDRGAVLFWNRLYIAQAQNISAPRDYRTSVLRLLHHDRSCRDELNNHDISGFDSIGENSILFDAIYAEARSPRRPPREQHEASGIGQGDQSFHQAGFSQFLPPEAYRVPVVIQDRQKFVRELLKVFRSQLNEEEAFEPYQFASEGSGETRLWGTAQSRVAPYRRVPDRQDVVGIVSPAPQGDARYLLSSLHMKYSLQSGEYLPFESLKNNARTQALADSCITEARRSGQLERRSHYRIKLLNPDHGMLVPVPMGFSADNQAVLESKRVVQLRSESCGGLSLDTSSVLNPLDVRISCAGESGVAEIPRIAPQRMLKFFPPAVVKALTTPDMALHEFPEAMQHVVKLAKKARSVDAAVTTILNGVKRFYAYDLNVASDPAYLAILDRLPVRGKKNGDLHAQAIHAAATDEYVGRAVCGGLSHIAIQALRHASIPVLMGSGFMVRRGSGEFRVDDRHAFPVLLLADAPGSFRLKPIEPTGSAFTSVDDCDSASRDVDRELADLTFPPVSAGVQMGARVDPFAQSFEDYFGVPFQEDLARELYVLSETVRECMVQLRSGTGPLKPKATLIRVNREADARSIHALDVINACHLTASEAGIEVYRSILARISGPRSAFAAHRQSLNILAEAAQRQLISDMRGFEAGLGPDWSLDV